MLAVHTVNKAEYNHSDKKALFLPKSIFLTNLFLVPLVTSLPNNKLQARQDTPEDLEKIH